MFLSALTSWIRRWASSGAFARPRSRARRRARDLCLEALEVRRLLSYSIVDLSGFAPTAINNSGAVVGSGNGHAALWQNGTTIDLGTLGGASSLAYDLNNLGEIVGLSQDSSSSQAFSWDSASGMQGLGVIGWAYGVNDAGQVVGTASGHSFIWDSTHGLTDLGTFGGTDSQARAINRSGQVTGWVENLSAYKSPTSYGYVWDSGTGSVTALAALPGYTASRAMDINDAGQVIGTSGFYTLTMHGPVYSPREACLWQNGVVIDLGMPNARAINNLGQVIGGQYLWQNGVLTDLSTQINPALGWTLNINSTLDTNDAGQIVGQGTLNGQAHYFLMSPADPTQVSSFVVAGFPAPATAGLPDSFTVIATNGNGTTATGYTGTVHFTSSDPQAGLPSDYTFTTADAGVHTFGATLKTAGTQSIVATDATAGLTGIEGGILVQAAATSQLAISGFPTSVTAGVAGSLTVTAQDAYGNVATGYAGTIHFGSSDRQALLPGDYTFTPTDGGTHSFNTTLKTAGTQWIAAADTLIPSLAATETGILVTPAAATRLQITGPASIKAGTSFSITVTAYDAYGNIATGYTGTVAFKSSDTSGTLPKNYTFTAADRGVHTFTGLILKRKGTQTVVVTDTLTGTILASVNLYVV